jgi:hypothetical protein
MKERVYHLKIHSISRFIIAMIIILLSSTFLILDKLPRTDNEIISMIQFLAVFVASFYLANLIGMGKVKVLFNEEGLIHIWQRRFFLSWEKNFKIPWNIVDNYLLEEDRTFDSFIINLTNKTRYKISRLNILPIKDDFEKLVKDFPKLSNEYKNGLTSSDNTTLIKKGESMYASKSFKWAFYFLSLGFLTLVLTKIFDTDFETTWSSLGVIGSGLIFYGLMIKRQRNNN